MESLEKCFMPIVFHGSPYQSPGAAFNGKVHHRLTVMIAPRSSPVLPRSHRVGNITAVDLSHVDLKTQQRLDYQIITKQEVCQRGYRSAYGEDRGTSGSGPRPNTAKVPIIIVKMDNVKQGQDITLSQRWVSIVQESFRCYNCDKTLTIRAHM